MKKENISLKISLKYFFLSFFVLQITVEIDAKNKKLTHLLRLKPDLFFLNIFHHNVKDAGEKKKKKKQPVKGKTIPY